MYAVLYGNIIAISLKNPKTVTLWG